MNRRILINIDVRGSDETLCGPGCDKNIKSGHCLIFGEKLEIHIDRFGMRSKIGHRRCKSCLSSKMDTVSCPNCGSPDIDFTMGRQECKACGFDVVRGRGR